VFLKNGGISTRDKYQASNDVQILGNEENEWRIVTKKAAPTCVVLPVD
jgi:hypothetical protein